MKKTTIFIKGTHCSACKMLIEDVCKETKGVISCTVDFKSGKTGLEHDENLDWNILKKEVESLGDYKVDVSSL